MRTEIRGLTIALLLRLPVLAADNGEQLAKDIASVASIVATNEKTYVTNYLSKGPSGLRGDEFLTATMARNALNKIQAEERVTLALARTMHRHAQGTNFPADTRQYGFTKLMRMAGRNEEIDIMARSLAEEIVKRNQDPLKRAAEGFLSQSRQYATQQLATNFTATQLVGRWRHVDLVRKLATTLTFSNDGTYTGSVEVSGKANGSFSGRWTLKGGRLHYEYTACSDRNIPVGAKDQDKIIELTKDHYTIENTLGLRETYARIE